jgi:hypothetical protein
MKYLSKLLLVLSIALVLYSFGSMMKAKITEVSSIEIQKEVIVKDIEIKAEVIKEVPNLNLFLNDIGFRESSNRYDVVNQYGYMGKYQFGIKTLESLGIDTTKKEFLSSPDLQEEAMITLLKSNQHNLRRQIKKYDGKLVNGILVTESGLLAAAHLGGPGSVKKWLRSGEDFKDGNGTKITSYIKTFNGYDLAML